MARPRLQLHDLLTAIAGNVYFQPPTNIQLKFPCIVYKRERSTSAYANNAKYRNHKRYEVTVIDRDPDSVLPDLVERLPLCERDRHFTADDLNHDVFILHF